MRARVCLSKLKCGDREHEKVLEKNEKKTEK